MPSTRATPGPEAGPVGPTWLRARAGWGVLVAAAWAVTVGVALDLGNGPGTMGLGLRGFLGVWVVMMTAMMGPVAITTASSGGPMSMSALGYLSVWAIAGAAAYALAELAGDLASDHPSATTATAVVVLIAVAAYQLTPIKARCLDRCRQPLRGRSARQRFLAGARKGGWCLGTSWAAMLVLIVFGLMSLTAMVAVATVLYAERFWLRGRRFRYLSAAAAVAVAALIAWSPALAEGVHQMTKGRPM